MATKLAKVVLFDDFDPESEDRALRSRVLTAGKGRTRELTGRKEPITDIELADDIEHRRVWVRTPTEQRWLPYERIRYAVVATDEPALKPVAPEKAIPQMVKQARGARDTR